MSPFINDILGNILQFAQGEPEDFYNMQKVCIQWNHVSCFARCLEHVKFNTRQFTRHAVHLKYYSYKLSVLPRILRSMSQLRTMKLDCDKFCGDGLQYLQSLQILRIVDCSAMLQTDLTLCSNLCELYLNSSTSIDIRNLHLPLCLTKLVISNAYFNLRSHYMIDLPHIKELDLNSTSRQDFDTELLSHMTQLVSLSLGGFKVNENDFNHVSQLTSLSLITYRSVSLCGLVHLKKLQKLDIVNEDNAQFSNLQHVAQYLTKLKVQSCNQFDGTYLKHLTNLRELDVSINKLITSSFKYTTQLTNLRAYHCEIKDDSGLAYLTNLKRLYIDNCKDVTLQPLLGHDQLQHVQIEHCNSVQWDVLGSLHNAKSIKIVGCPSFKYDNIVHILHFPNIAIDGCDLACNNERICMLKGIQNISDYGNGVWAPL
jgi:Leucine-rich repeat (LRR) protein